MESIADAAFGKSALALTTWLVAAVCFFAIVGYAVLLRDLLEPVTDFIFDNPASDLADTEGPTLKENATMVTVVLIMTPFCTLKTLTALRAVGAASMCAILVLGICVTYRSIQCNFFDEYKNTRHQDWSQFVEFTPESIKDALNALPLFISCFVCHYNVPLVHNELIRPTKERVRVWLRLSVWSATVFYLVIGFAGSMYGNCTPTGHIHGNILLDFSENDPVILVGRLSLAVTIAFAFPMLVIPARDTLLRQMGYMDSADMEDGAMAVRNTPRVRSDMLVIPGIEDMPNPPELVQPLLEGADALSPDEDGNIEMNRVLLTDPAMTPRIVLALSIFWTSTALACSVTSIDFVWDLLGSSISIMISYLIPCASLVKIMWNYSKQERTIFPWTATTIIATILTMVFFPLMFISTGNAVYNVFLS